MDDQPKLRVHANPYAALDHKGRPAATVPIPGSVDVYIGAEIDYEASRKEDVRVFKFRPNDVIEFPVDTHILRLLQEGALLPADEGTAKLAGLTDHGTLAIAASKDAAVALHEARYGTKPRGHETWGAPPAHEHEVKA